MRDLLTHQRLWKVLVRERPEEISVGDWQELEEMAFSTIRMCLCDQLLPAIARETTANDLWKKLEHLYMGRNMTNKLWAKKQLYSLRMHEGTDLREYIQRFNLAAQEVVNVHAKL